MLVFRVLALGVLHGGIAASFALLAQAWIVATSGRVSATELLTASNAFPGLANAAALAGAVLGPVLHLVMGLALARERALVGVGALLGVAYALAVMMLTLVVWIAWTAVIGRGPEESISTALANAAFTVTFGMPLFMVTGTLMTGPVLALGGIVIGLLVAMIERRPHPLHRPRQG